jgi:hypothetical protein
VSEETLAFICMGNQAQGQKCPTSQRKIQHPFLWTVITQLSPISVHKLVGDPKKRNLLLVAIVVGRGSMMCV